MKHRIHPLDWDTDGDWDGVVKYHRGSRQFVRYTDRNGEHWEPIAPVPLSVLLPNGQFWGVFTRRTDEVAR
jgi:hypothetical protein